MFESISARKAVAIAVKTEELGAKVYRRLARKFADRHEIQQLFSTLAEDEARHAAQFSALYEYVDQNERRSYAEKYGEIRAIVISEFFSKRDGLMRVPESIDSPMDVLQRALEMEQATIAFYKEIGDVVGNLEVVVTILDAERSHAESIKAVMQTLGKTRLSSLDTVTDA